MAETYCGKSCAECTYRQEKQCLGCKAGPGTGCDIGRCVMGKGHSTCNTCTYIAHCGIYRGRDKAMENRIRAKEAEQVRQEEIRARTAGLHKVFYLLFWLVIIGVIGSLMTEEFLAEPYPLVGTIGQYIKLLTSLIYGFVLLSQFGRQREYLAAGILSIAAPIVEQVYLFLNGGRQELSPVLLIGLAATVIHLIGIYKEFTAHSEALIGIEDLADKWSRLWYWYIGAYAATFGSVLVLAVSRLLGALLLVVGSVGAFVVNIVKVMYLHRSASYCAYYQDTEVNV